MTMNFNINEVFNRLSRQILLDNPVDRNVVISPYSVASILGMMACGSATETRDEILNVLAPDMDYDSIMASMRELQIELERDGSLMAANAVCLKEEYADNVFFAFAEDLGDFFDGKLFSSEDLVTDVNKWVCKNTKGMIDKVLDEDAAGLLMVLLNAITFKDGWLTQCEKTVSRQFVSADGTKSKLNFISSQEDLYIEDDVFTGFIKPYNSSEYSFMALLPKKTGADAMISAIDEADLPSLFRDAQFKTVDAKMPEFTIDFNSKLNDTLKKMGINLAFEEGADFSNIMDEPLLAESVLHKVHIEVDKKGTKAAAVTAVTMLRCLPPEMEDKKKVVLNRPFIFAIMHNETCTPVFTGCVNKL